MSPNDMRSLLEGYCLDKARLIQGKLHIVSETEMTLDGLSAPAMPCDLIRSDALPEDTRIVSLDPLVLDKPPLAAGDFDAIISQFTAVSDAWLVNTRDRQVIPVVKNMTGLGFDGVKEAKERKNGTGGRTLYLNRKPVVEIKSIYAERYGVKADMRSCYAPTIEIRKEEGALVTDGRFEKGDGNFVIEYTYGYSDVPDDLKRAVCLITASLALGFIASKTGGGANVSTQGYSRSFGARGKFTEVRNDFDRWAYALLRPYYSGITVL